MNRRWLLLGCIGCGPLHGVDYRGEPLYTLAGRVQSTGEMEWLLGPESEDITVTVGLFWARSGEPSLEQQAQVTTTFPARYELVLHEPPPEASLLDVEWAPGPVALGLPLLFLDDNQDGRRSDEEPLVGNALGIHVLYATESGTIEVPGQSFDVVPGFQRVGAQDTACDVSGAPIGLQLVPSDVPTNLLIGPAFLQLIDIDCDGSPDDWDACPTGDYLDQWCEQASTLLVGHPCLKACGFNWSRPPGP